MEVAANKRGSSQKEEPPSLLIPTVEVAVHERYTVHHETGPHGFQLEVGRATSLEVARAMALVTLLLGGGTIHIMDHHTNVRIDVD